MHGITKTTSDVEGLWLQTAASTSYPSPSRGLETDVAVVGGGIAGLTAAVLLKREGARVAVLEAHRVGCASSRFGGVRVHDGEGQCSSGDDPHDHPCATRL